MTTERMFNRFEWAVLIGAGLCALRLMYGAIVELIGGAVVRLPQLPEVLR